MYVNLIYSFSLSSMQRERYLLLKFKQLYTLSIIIEELNIQTITTNQNKEV